MSWLTTAEGHIAIGVAVIADIVSTIVGLRVLHRKINNHINGKE